MTLFLAPFKIAGERFGAFLVGHFRAGFSLSPGLGMCGRGIGGSRGFSLFFVPPPPAQRFFPVTVDGRRF